MKLKELLRNENEDIRYWICDNSIGAKPPMNQVFILVKWSGIDYDQRSHAHTKYLIQDVFDSKELAQKFADRRNESASADEFYEVFPFVVKTQDNIVA